MENLLYKIREIKPDTKNVFDDSKKYIDGFNDCQFLVSEALEKYFEENPMDITPVEWSAFTKEDSNITTEKLVKALRYSRYDFINETDVAINQLIRFLLHQQAKIDKLEKTVTCKASNKTEPLTYFEKVTANVDALADFVSSVAIQCTTNTECEQFCNGCKEYFCNEKDCKNFLNSEVKGNDW